MPDEPLRTPTESDSFHAIAELLKSGAFTKDADRREAARIVEALQSQTQYLTPTQKDELSASVDDTLGSGEYPTPSAFWALWPQRPYFEAYQHIIEKAEAPPVFHFFAAATALGAAAGLRLWYPTQPTPLYANMAVCLVGPTGKVKKTTATVPAMDLLEALNAKEECVAIIRNKANPRSLTKFLSSRQNGDCLIYAPEFSVFMSKDKAAEGIVPTLADLLDTHKKAGDLTITHTQQLIHNTCLSLLSASNIELLLHSAPYSMLTSGLMNRIIFVVQDVRYRRSTLQDWMAEFPAEVSTDALEYLQWANNIKPQPVEVSKDAFDVYNAWYQSISDNIDPMLAAYVERKHVHVLRLALILALADKRTEIKRRDIEDSIAIMGWVQTFIPVMLERMQNVDRDLAYDYVIRKITQSHDRDPDTSQRTITKGKLARSSHWKLSKLNRVLRDLVVAGLIRKCSQFPERYALVRLKK